MPKSEMRYYSQGELEKFREECPPQFIGCFQCVLEDLEAMRSERDQLLYLVNGRGEIHNRAVETLDLRGALRKVSDFFWLRRLSKRFFKLRPWGVAHCVDCGAWVVPLVESYGYMRCEECDGIIANVELAAQPPNVA